ncbi:glycosyltransferase [Chloroflexota bacterium]
MKVYLYGRDGIGWSVDFDRYYTESFLRRLGFRLAGGFLRADVVHSVWWNQLLNYSAYPLRWKKIMAVLTNDADISSRQFRQAGGFVDLWIAPNNAIYERLKSAGLDVKYQPFYVDEKIFLKEEKSKKQIAVDLGIDPGLIENRLVIGSFQRDSLGEDLGKPKPQKGPDILVEILKQLPQKDYILLLAGPRRHWLLNRCRELGIPCCFLGEEPAASGDDIRVNTLDKKTMNKLYNLSDLYIVSSRSEGGPKAVLESAFTETMILSTGVGLAPDFLHPWCLYATAGEAADKVKEMLQGKDVAPLVQANYDKAMSVASYEPTLERWGAIYGYFRDKYIRR